MDLSNQTYKTMKASDKAMTATREAGCNDSTIG
jgi:hypothetical protein